MSIWSVSSLDFEIGNEGIAANMKDVFQWLIYCETDLIAMNRWVKIIIWEVRVLWIGADKIHEVQRLRLCNTVYEQIYIKALNKEGKVKR